MLVYYPGAVTPAAMRGYDGVQHQPAGSGTASAKFVVAYSGSLPDGYIFNFGEGLPAYRYQAAPSPVSIDTTNGWPPPNIFVFPSQVIVNGHTLTVTSYTNGLDNGYWANAYYQGTNVYGQLYAYVAPDGSGGSLYGNVNGTDVSADWDSTTSAFVASPTLDLGTTVPASPPVYGRVHYSPPQVEWNGTLIPFAFNDVNSSDVYWNPSAGVWVIIDSDYSVTTSDGSSGTYDRDSLMFSYSGNLAAVSADGTTFLGASPGVEAYNLSSQLAINYGEWQSATPTYYFTSPNGKTAEYFVGFCSSVFVFTGDGLSPGYLAGNDIKVIDAANGWPAGDVPPLPYPPPSQIYINGQEFDWSGWPDYTGTIMYCRYFESQGAEFDLAMVYNSTGAIWWDYGFGSFSPTVIAYGAGFSNDGTIYLSFTPPRVPLRGPARIGRNGISIPFAVTQNGIDMYLSSGVQISIDSSNHVTVNSSASGTYAPATCGFTAAGMVAQDANANLLGTPPGLLINFTQNQWPGGDPTGSGGKSIQLGDGSFRNSGNTTVYSFQRMDGTWYVKYCGVPENSLFVVQDGQGSYSSPVYRYTADGGDCVIDTTSAGDWPASDDLYPAAVYANGHCATLDSSSQGEWGSDNTSHGGQVTYRVQPDTGDSLTIGWTWNNGFSATVNGSYGSFTIDSGTWDAGKIFGGLPDGLIISVEHPPCSARYNGPQQIQWNGIDLRFNPILSSISGSNPQGANVYKDVMGLGLTATVGSDGSVILTRADGTQVTGSYNLDTLQFTFTGHQKPGTVQAVDSNGTPLVPSQNVGGGNGTNGNPGTPGNFDIEGNVLSLGSWTPPSGGSMNGFSLVYTDATASPSSFTNPALLRFMAARQFVDWKWSHADTDGGSSQIPMAEIDQKNRLLLYDPAHPATPAIILDPAGKSHFAPQGDLDMGDYTHQP